MTMNPRSLDDAFLGRCSAWTVRPLDNASFGRLVPRKKAPLDDASLGQCVPWTMRPLDGASLGRLLPWMTRLLDGASLGRWLPWMTRLLDNAYLTGVHVPTLDCIEAAANHNNKFLKLRLPDTWTTSRMPSLQPLHSEEWNVWDCAIYWTFRPCKRCIVHRTLRTRDTLCKGSMILEKLYVIRVYIQRRIVKSPKSA
jgi:hypothetical protein